MCDGFLGRLNPPVCYSPQKRPEMSEVRSFFTILCKSCDGILGRLNAPQTPKLYAIAHENGQKARNHEIFTIS